MHIVCNRPGAQYLIYHLFSDKIVVGSKRVDESVIEYLEFPEPRGS